MTPRLGVIQRERGKAGSTSMRRLQCILLALVAASCSGEVGASSEREHLWHARRSRSLPGRKLKFDMDPEAKSTVGEHLYHRIALRELDAGEAQLPSELGIGPACMCTSSKDGVKSAEEAALPNSDFEREDRCLPGLCAEEELYHRPETPVCPSDVKAWGSPIRWENMTTIDEFEEFTLDSGFYRLIAYELWPEQGLTVIENSTTASEYATPVCESIRRKLDTNETWYPCYTECNVELCEKEVASTGVGDDGQFCGGGICPLTNYYCGFTWMQCGAIVRLRRPVSVAITNNAFITRNGHVINCNARMLMPNACNKYEDLLTQTTPSSEIDYMFTYQNKRYEKVITLAQNIYGVYEIIVQIMPRLMSVWEYYKSDPSIKIHLGSPTGVRDLMEQYFTALGVPADRIIYGDVFAEDVIVADTSCGAVRASSNGILLNKLREALRENIAKERPWVTAAKKSLVVVKRKGRRQVKNHKEMVKAIENRMDDKSSVLGQCDYELDVYEPGVDPWEKDFRKAGTKPIDIFARFYNAAVVVGPHGGGFSNIIVSKPGSMLLDFMEPVPTIPELLNDPSLRSDPAILSYAFAEIARAIGQHHIALMPDFFRPNKFTEIRLDGDQESYYVVDPQQIVNSIEEGILRFGCGQ